MAELQGRKGVRKTRKAGTRPASRIAVTASGWAECVVSIQALALGDVARAAASLALHGGGGLALTLLGRLLVELALAGLGKRPDGCAMAKGAAIIRGSPVASGGFQTRDNRMPSVKVRENEPFEFALRRFKRTCEKAGVLAETRKREFYEKPTQERKRKAAAAVKRQARRSSRDVTKRQRLY